MSAIIETLTLLLAIPAAAIGGLWYWASRALRKSKAADLERRMLRIVQAKRGRVTDVELALESRATLEQTRKFLKEMVDHGAAQTHIGPEGRPVYVFHDFLTEEQKRAAVPATEWTPSRPTTREVPPPLDVSPRPIELGDKPVHLEPKPLDLER